MKYLYKKNILVGYTRPVNKKERNLLRNATEAGEVKKIQNFYILKEFTK